MDGIAKAALHGDRLERGFGVDQLLFDSFESQLRDGVMNRLIKAFIESSRKCSSSRCDV